MDGEKFPFVTFREMNYVCVCGWNLLFSSKLSINSRERKSYNLGRTFVHNNNNTNRQNGGEKGGSRFHLPSRRVSITVRPSIYGCSSFNIAPLSDPGCGGTEEGRRCLPRCRARRSHLKKHFRYLRAKSGERERLGYGV